VNSNNMMQNSLPTPVMSVMLLNIAAESMQPVLTPAVVLTWLLKACWYYTQLLIILFSLSTEVKCTADRP
jgi:hypothetical protein